MCDTGAGGATAAATGTGVGLANVRERLRLSYGAAGEMHVDQAPRRMKHCMHSTPWPRRSMAFTGAGAFLFAHSAAKAPAGCSRIVADLLLQPTDRDNPQAVLQGFGDAQIIEALKQLPEEIRWSLLLVDVEQLDQTEAARVLDVPVGTIKSRLHRGRAMLRAALSPLARQMRLI